MLRYLDNPADEPQNNPLDFEGEDEWANPPDAPPPND